MRKKIEKNFWDMEIIGNRRKKDLTPLFNKTVGNDEVILLRRDALFLWKLFFLP